MLREELADMGPIFALTVDVDHRQHRLPRSGEANSKGSGPWLPIVASSLQNQTIWAESILHRSSRHTSPMSTKLLLGFGSWVASRI